MKINVYVDGFNLYYGCLKGSPFRWLNLAELCRQMLPKDQIHKIKYFTALVSARPNDPGQPSRQQVYLRALRTLPNVSIILGHFLSNKKRMMLATPIPGQSAYVEVIKTEEKGSDVNLAVHLLNDGYLGDYEGAVVISNDSDLLEAIQIVKNQLQHPVGILCPHRIPSIQLKNNATFFLQIHKKYLKASQFPSTLTDANGTFGKPATW